jgi:hypothetical protein
MRSTCALILLLFTSASLLRADGSLEAETLQSLKDATVFLKVEAGKLSASGSGFLLRTERKRALLVTNYHVVRPSTVAVKGSGKSAKRFRAVIADATVTAVFASGTRKERVAKANVIAEDPDHDLAILEVAGEDLPKPIRTDRPPKLTETMPVYVLGFPFGRILTTSKGHPAITIGKGSISSLRQDDAGELAFIQIDGALNPGNSGGPVVDAKGQLVGVAVAKIKDSGGIGLAIPAQQLGRLLEGSIGQTTLRYSRRRDAIELRIEARVIDPLGRLRSVAFHVAPGTSVGKGLIAALPNARKAKLSIKDGVATGSVLLPMRERDTAVVFQSEFVNETGKPQFTAARSVPLKPATAEPAAARPLSREELTQTLADLESGSVTTRRLACVRLARAEPGAGRAEVLEALAKLLRDADAFARRDAVQAHLAWADRRKKSTLYYDLLKGDTSVLVRAVLIEGLARLDGARAAEAIAARLAEEADRPTARKALVGMGAEAEKAVLAQLSSRDGAVRLEACKLLEEIGTAASVPALKKAHEGLSRFFSLRVESAATKAVATISSRK